MLDVLLGTPLWVPVAIFVAYLLWASTDQAKARKLRATIPPRGLPDGSHNPAYYDHEDRWREVQRQIDRLDPPRI